jgi:hypothetical protein
VAEIKVRLSTVGQHIDLSVLKRIHGSRINVEIRIQFLKCHPQSTMLKQGPQGCTCKSFPERTDHASRDKNILH